MEHLDTSSPSYNYYPRTMIQLCVISYDDMSVIPTEVSQSTDLQVVWGPAELVSDWDVSYSLAYIVMRPNPLEYTLVIRGTNMYSWDSWTQEDFAIGPPLQPFNQLAPHAPSTALISQGTLNGMNDLLSLTDPNTGLGIVDFLKQANFNYLYVTGHSLGGTLTPPMLCYLNDILYGGGWLHAMASWSFAGLTSGDQGFAQYYNSQSNPVFPWRLHNTLDIAPFCWYSQSDVQNIYAPYDLNWGWPEDSYLNSLFAEAAGSGYTQPTGDQALPGAFNYNIIDEYLWTAQASYQHHSTTYQSLVNAMYPVAQTAMSG